MTTPIQTIYNFLDEQGLFDSWADPEGETVSPVTVQMRVLEENCESVKSNMILLIKQNGGSADRFTSDPVFTFSVFTKVDQSAVYAESYANLLYATLLSLDSYVNIDGEGGFDSCVVSSDPMSAVNGAYKTESGRYVYDFDFMLQVDSGFVL